MQSSLGRQSFTLVWVVGAVAFGMVLAGGLELTPDSAAAPVAEGTPVSVSPPGGLPSFADLAEAVSPAVVSIRATTIERGDEPRREANPFELFFDRRRQPNPRRPGEQPERRSDSAGSGFVISPDGFIVTNYHVIDGATDLHVLLDGREYSAEVIGQDPATDLALLSVDAGDDLAYLPLSNSDRLRVGDWLMVIGSPLRLENSVSVGVVSAKGRSINITPDSGLENFIQTDAAINFGNSGGPVVDLTGSVVGIATAINFGAENIGFAVPSNTLQNILPQLREHGKVSRGYLGVNIGEIDFDTAQAFGLDSTDGALVTLVVEDGPAEAGGLRHGDIILEVDDHHVTTNRDLIDYVSSLRPETDVVLGLSRNGKRIERTVTLGERPNNGRAPQVVQPEESSSIDWLGISYQDLTPGIRDSHNLPEDLDGVWVTDVSASSPLYDEGVRQGDFLVEVNGTPVPSTEDFENIVERVASGGFLRLYVSRFDPRSGQQVSFFAIVRVP